MLPARQLTNDHEPVCMCHCIFFRINPRVNVYLKHHAICHHRATVIIHFCCTHIFPRDCPSCVLHFVYITPINLCASKNKKHKNPSQLPMHIQKHTHTPILKITYNIKIKKKILLYSKKIILENNLRLGSGELGAEVVT